MREFEEDGKNEATKGEESERKDRNGRNGTTPMDILKSCIGKPFLYQGDNVTGRS